MLNNLSSLFPTLILNQITEYLNCVRQECAQNVGVLLSFSYTYVCVSIWETILMFLWII